MYKRSDKKKENTEADGVLIRTNLKRARQLWGTSLSHALEDLLRFYSEEFGVSLKCGDLLLLQAKWYVTHSGLLRLATRRRCSGINVAAVPELCDASNSRWAFKATVYKSLKCRGFVGYGDADPSNVSPQVRGAEMRVAETRAVNRALRKAYGIGICSVEELGAFSGPRPSAAQTKNSGPKTEPVNGNGHHPLRDRLYLLIHQHQLDPALVKAYAADYCDVPELRQASREQVAGFMKHLAEYTQSDREGLLCQLNSYARKPASEALVQIANGNTANEPEKAAGAA